MEKYKVTNTTIKPLVTDEKGRDVRKPSERRGHSVSFSDKAGKTILLQAGRFAVVEELDHALMKFEEDGLVKIEPIKDMGSVLEAFRAQGKQTATIEKTEAPRVRMTEMGDAPIYAKGGNEYEGAINPDGEPNFVVRAPHKL